MNKLFRMVTGQKNLGKQWGVIAQVAGQVSIFVSMIILILSMTTAYNTTLSGWFASNGIHIDFWLFAGIVGVIIIIPAILVWKFALPSYLSSLNEQIYKHDNPIKRDIAMLSEDNAEIKKLLEELLERK